MDARHELRTLRGDAVATPTTTAISGGPDDSATAADTTTSAAAADTVITVLDAAGIKRPLSLDSILRQFEATPTGGPYSFDDTLAWMAPGHKRENLVLDKLIGDDDDDDGDGRSAAAAANFKDGVRFRRLNAMSAADKAQERRARNRVHARRTRERKKLLLQVTHMDAQNFS